MKYPMRDSNFHPLVPGNVRGKVRVFPLHMTTVCSIPQNKGYFTNDNDNYHSFGNKKRLTFTVLIYFYSKESTLKVFENWHHIIEVGRKCHQHADTAWYPRYWSMYWIFQYILYSTSVGDKGRNIARQSVENNPSMTHATPYLCQPLKFH